MRSTFGGLEIGKRSLFAQQAALNTVGHNIANANTEGYTRQRVELVASRPLPYPAVTNSRDPAQVGTGVAVDRIVRLREDFLDRQYRNESKYLGYWQAKTDTYAKLEVVLNEPSEKGLQSAMDRLWKAWQDLSANAEDAAARTVVVGQAVGLTEAFRHIADSLKELQLDLDNAVNVKVNEINSIAAQIRDLNDQIGRLQPHGYTTNDLLDKRDLLLDKLSKLVDVQVTPAQNGMVNVSIAGGQALVTGTAVQLVEAIPNGTTGLYDVTIGGAPLQPVSGELLGVLESRGRLDANGRLTGIIPDMMAKINTLATTFAKEINQLHMGGLNLDDLQKKEQYEKDVANGLNPPAPKYDRLPFFISKSWYESLADKDLSKIDFSQVPLDQISPKNAGDFLVNPLIQADTDKVAAAGSNAQGPADGENAKAIAALKYKVLTSGLPNSSTLEGYYQLIIAQLGVDAQQADNMVGNKELLVNQVDNRRQSVSGVSLDEETAEMIKYQHAYNAAARSITVMDEILDKIINGMGIVGR